MKCTGCTRTITPVVAIDIDGTLGDYHGHFLDFLAGYFGAPLPDGWDGNGDWEDFLGLSRRDYQDAKLAYRQGGWKRTMPLLPDARLFMASITELHPEVEIWLTTTRPWLRLDSVDPDTREWLNRNGFVYDHLMYDDDKYTKLANLVDPERVVLVVDDLLDLCMQAEGSLGPDVPVQVERQHNSHQSAEYHTRKSLTFTYHILEQRLLDWHEEHG